MAAPRSAITRDDTNALAHLETCLTYQRHWCEHKTSVTISVKEDEWAAVGDWVYDHFNELAGAAPPPPPTSHRGLRLSEAAVRTLRLVGVHSDARLTSTN